MSKATAKTAPAKREYTPTERIEMFRDSAEWVLPSKDEHAKAFKADAERMGLPYAIKRNGQNVMEEAFAAEILAPLFDALARLTAVKTGDYDVSPDEFGKLLLELHDGCVERVITRRSWERVSGDFCDVAEEMASASAFAKCAKATGDMMKYFTQLRSHLG